MRSVRDILSGRLVKRSISLKAMNQKEPQKAFEGTLRQEIELTNGLPKDKAKELTKIIKNF